jgi:hypothetical protein
MLLSKPQRKKWNEDGISTISTVRKKKGSGFQAKY